MQCVLCRGRRRLAMGKFPSRALPGGSLLNTSSSGVVTRGRFTKNWPGRRTYRIHIMPVSYNVQQALNTKKLSGDRASYFTACVLLLLTLTLQVLGLKGAEYTLRVCAEANNRRGQLTHGAIEARAIEATRRGIRAGGLSY
jgi:hypothetical protein